MNGGRPRRIGTARLVALALCIGFGLAFVIANVRSWELEDANAYWNAALRLQHGLPLYVAVDPNADEAIAYRYAPWLAWLWIPLTALPKGVAQVTWSGLLIVGAAVALLPLARVRSVSAICLLFLLGGLVLRTASTGNVHVLVIASLVWGAHRRSGPLWVGVAASLKLAPLAYVLVYLGRREWRNATLAIGTFVVLTAPILLYSLANYPVDPGESLSLLSIAGPVSWALAALAAAGAAVALARGRFAWPAASVAAIAAAPRLDYYDLTYLLVGLPGRLPAAPGVPTETRTEPSGTP